MDKDATTQKARASKALGFGRGIGFQAIHACSGMASHYFETLRGKDSA